MFLSIMSQSSSSYDVTVCGSGASRANAEVSDLRASAMRTHQLEKELQIVKAELSDTSEAYESSKELVARLERESNLFASQQESMVLDHQYSYKQLEAHVEQLQIKVPDAAL